jgi:methionyl aminopeptidase
MDDTETSLWAGIAALRVGGDLYAVGAAVEDSLTESGARRGREYGIVEDYVGHGIGTSMHMDPQVPNYRVTGKGPRVVEGTTICIEPMVTLGDQDNTVLEDEWTVVTRDGSRAAHWEHSVAVTSAGICVLTALDGGAARLAQLGAPHVAIDPA